MKTPKNLELFLRAYETINTNHKKFKEYLTHKDINQEQKSILKAVYALKKNKPHKALEIISNTSVQNDFLKLYQSYICGLIHNHMGNFELASKNLTTAILGFDSYNDKKHIYKPISAISMLYLNMKDVQRLKKYYQVFLSFKDESSEHQILDYNYQIFINLLEQNKERTLEKIKELRLSFEKEISSNLKMYLIFEFMIYLSHDNFDECYEVLKQYKDLGGFGVKSNYKYMLTLLNFFTKNASIYAYKRDFQEVEYLFYQLKVIQCLDLHNIEEAKEYWVMLEKLNPSVYSEKFNYTAPKDLFKISLQKALQKIGSDTSTQSDSQIDLQKLKALTSNTAKLEYIFSLDGFYLSKDQLIELIWEEQWSPKNDQKLRTLISRVLKKNNFKVENIDGKYKKAA